MSIEVAERIVFENTHEAIISKEDFEKVKEIKSKDSENFIVKSKESEKIRNSFINLFNGEIYCGYCGRVMWYRRKLLCGYEDRSIKNWRAYYNCSSNIRKLNTTCSKHHIQEKELQEKVLNAIKLQVKVGLNYEI